MKDIKQIICDIRCLCPYFPSVGEDGLAGMLDLTCGKRRRVAFIASWGMGWEHVSISTPLWDKVLPTWEEMCYVKDLFWRPDEAVIQIHPPEADYVNFHPTCLHLWRPTDRPIPLPPTELIGPRTGR